MPTALTPTTASAAISAAATSITLASVSGVTVGEPLFVDGEGMKAKWISGLNVGVKRGQFNTRQRAHASGVTVWPGTEATFKQGIPLGRGDASLQQYMPYLTFAGHDGEGQIFTLGGPDGTQWLNIPLESSGRREVVRQYRERVTIAAVNAGETLLAAMYGFKYRMTDCYIISVGGAAAAVTSVDVIGTLSASARKLVAFLVAGLTQSTLLRAGAATNGVLLADGASFTANDRATAITIGKTGSDVTTSTHFDVAFNYVIE